MLLLFLFFFKKGNAGSMATLSYCPAATGVALLEEEKLAADRYLHRASWEQSE